MAGADTSAEPLIDALTVSTLASRGALEDAALLAASLARRHPDFAPGRALHELLNDASMDEQARLAALDHWSRHLRAVLDETLAARQREAERQARIERVLDERLWPAARAEEGSTEPMLVSVLLDEAASDPGARLTAAGFEIVAEASGRRHVVASAATARLRELAQLDVVRRVEPLQPQ
jgi:hypothetical protein